MRIPYTILLVLVGLLLVPITSFAPLSFLNSFQFTPDLLFFLILPVLIFESSYHINEDKFAQNILPILLLAIVSLLISIGIIGFGGSLFFGALGLHIPFLVWLLFGALISATDPVAVLSLFKELGAPRRLALLMEGESLFNDGTALAAFLVLLGAVEQGFFEREALLGGIAIFCSMLIGGALFGFLMGSLFSKLLQYGKSEENLQVMVTLVMAHLTFILAELVSHLSLGGVSIPISPIIATTIASIIMGNYGRYKISAAVESYLTRFWSSFAFLANAIVFLLMGLIYSTLPLQLQLFSPLVFLGMYGVIFLARACSIYPVVGLLSFLFPSHRIPLSWQHLLVWGGLRGALALIMALLIPADLTVPGWGHSFSIRDLILALTISSIYINLFLHATTLRWLLQKLGLHELKTVERVEYVEARQMVFAKVLMKLSKFHSRGYITSDVFADLKKKYTSLYRASQMEGKSLTRQSKNVFLVVLRLFTVGIERQTLQDLFSYGEISGRVYKKIADKLSVVVDHLESDSEDVPCVAHVSSRSMIGYALHRGRQLLFWKSRNTEVADKYMYYRALAIMARKARKELDSPLIHEISELFDNAQAIDVIRALYRELENEANAKAHSLYETHTHLLSALTHGFAERGISKVEQEVLDALLSKEIITPKVFVQISKELSLDEV